MAQDSIAVVGLDLLFPGDAQSPESFYDMLLSGRSALTDIPKDRYNIEAFYHPHAERPGTTNVRKAHFIREDIAAFDAPFFSITSTEASCMDPQQRGLLECTYKALESAGIPLKTALGSNTSVHVGCFTREYDSVVSRDPELDRKYIATGTGTAMLSNRLSWFYDFKGPSLTLDTACSSSLNACHLACQGLKTGESSMAIVAGCNLFYNPDTVIPLTSLGFLSADGKCYSFDHRANGYSRGEGFGVMVLKRLSEAIRDGNTIRAVITNTTSNQDGRSPGITQPTKEAQAKLIRKAYESAGIDPSETRFFEAHGTGTPVGDPIEASAISEVFTKYRSPEEPLYIGAVKTNIGHLEGSAGMAGLLKTTYVLERGVIPPNLWFEKPNPKILADKWNFKFPTEPTPWPTDGLRRASINSFGFGGSNAHVIMEDAYHYLRRHNLTGIHRTIVEPASLLKRLGNLTTAQEATDSPADGLELTVSRSTTPPVIHDPTTDSESTTSGTATPSNDETDASDTDASEVLARPRARVFNFSSYDDDGIRRLAESYKLHLEAKAAAVGAEDEEQVYLDDLCYTLSEKRSAFTWRASVTADSLSTLVQGLAEKLKPTRAGASPSLAFVFTGQGAQWYAMGRELMGYPVFNQSLQAAEKHLKTIGCSWNLLDELMKDERSSNMNDPELSQTIGTALQVALVETLQSWDVIPSAVVGHSSGEIAAAFAAGAISRDSAWELAFHRGVLSSSLARHTKSRGALGMISVALGPDQATSYLTKINASRLETDHLTIACYNSPKNVTISGAGESLDALKELLDQEEIFARRLQVENAYHSDHMKSIADEYEQKISKLQAGTDTGSRLPKFYSSLTGSRITADQLCQPKYWVENLVSPVKFSNAVSTMLIECAAKAKKLGSAQAAIPLTELLEIGPHAALRGPLREIMEQIPSAKDVGYESVLKRNTDAIKTSLATAGWLFCRGYQIKTAAVNFAPVSDVVPSLLVDLPTYPFNHSKTYWSESRISKNYRFREKIRHELLGAPVPDWNINNAIWRNWIRLAENPWVADHRITGTILYPAAGMLVMAIEASRQIANPDKVLKGFRFREVVLHMALRVPNSLDGVETHFYLRPHMDSTTSTASTWSEFQLYSHEAGEWREHCRGLIQTEYEAPYTPVDNGLEDQLLEEACQQAVNEAELFCDKDVSTKGLYELLQTVGFDFGPTFQNLSDVRIASDKTAVATITRPDLASKLPHGYLQPHLIHPATLDGIFQSVVVALTRGGREVRETMVPTSMKELWVSAAAGASYENVRLCTHAAFLGLRQAEASITAIDPISRKPLIIADGFVSTAVSGRQGNSDEETFRHLCFNPDWKPEPSFIDQEQASKSFPAPAHLTQNDPTQLIANTEKLCYMYLKRYMNSNPVHDFDQMKSYHRKYLDWIKHQFSRYEAGEMVHATSDWNKAAEDEQYFAQLEAEMEEAAPETRLCVEVGKALPKILSGELDALQVLFNNKLIENVYRHGTGAEIGYSKLCGYLDVLAHQNPALSICEIGAGTGGATLPVMETLTHHGEHETGAMRFEEYAFTDISPSFFEAAKELFKDTIDRMNFKVLNIENDPAPQGFEEGRFDVVIASNVIHATKNIEKTLRNVRKLLKPGGQFLLYELTNTSLIRAGFGFGLLPGWWLSDEPTRAWGPLLSTPDWSSRLQRTGFSGVDLCFDDHEVKANQINSVIVSTAVSQASDKKASPVFCIVAEPTQLQLDVASELQQGLTGLGVETCEIMSLAELKTTDCSKRMCIFLPEVESSILDGIEADIFTALQKSLFSLSGILWLTNGGGRNASNPLAELVTGFARVVRAENAALKFLTLSIDTIKSASSVAKSALKLVEAILIRGDAKIIDNSFYESDGIIQISRMVEANYMNSAIALKTTQPVAQLAPFGQDKARALKLYVESPGLLDSLQFDDDPVYDQPLLPGEVEFKIEASGLNFLDIMVSLGQVIGTDLGVEGAGTVTRTGPHSRFKIGDRVCGIAKGTMKTYARVLETSLVTIPDHMEWTIAASMPVVYVTAYAALYDIANIQRGETVLIHAAAGGVGQACIQLAQLRGAKVFATVGSLEKRDLLERTYGIPRGHILSSRDLTFATGIKRLTKGKGVDVVVNALSGAAMRATWDCIAPFGRFVEVGKVDIYSSARLSMDKFKENVSFEFVDVGFMAYNRGTEFQRILSDVMRLVRTCKIRELEPVQVYPFGKLKEAFRYMQSGAHSGKIVLQPHDNDLVPVVPSRKPTYDLNADATYLISGGLGGLGRSIARWMVGRGARNLILLSRSGATRDSGKELVAELKAKGVNIATPSCDVADQTSLRKVLDECLQLMPPIRGCIQGSMVLKDVMYQNMTIDDWNTAIRPKVQASWNLHECLPQDLDFFILLSSAAGMVGNRGQANYAAGNTYQDALARYRVQKGLKAIAIDLGMILSVGFAAENAEIMGHLRAQGFSAIREEELHAMLDELCNHNLSLPSQLKSQISLGFELPETLRSKNIEMPGWIHDPIFKHLFQIRTAGSDGHAAEDHINYNLLLSTAESLDAAAEIICEAMVKKLCKALSIDVQDVDSAKPLHSFGVDSLVAVELRTWLLKEIGADVAVFDMMGGSSIRALSSLVATRSTFVQIASETE